MRYYKNRPAPPVWRGAYYARRFHSNYKFAVKYADSLRPAADSNRYPRVNFVYAYKEY
ncbi:hypothetical protein AGATL06_18270 [Agathobaculum sp. TL06]